MLTTNLMNEEMRKRIPTLRSTHTPSPVAAVHVCYLMPDRNWFWYGIEYDGDNQFLGLIVGESIEFNYFLLSDLEQLEGLWHMPVMRVDPWHIPSCEYVLLMHTDRKGIELLLP